MSRQEGVSCDCCSVSNFVGRRFKCLVCPDYDLCSTCYDKEEHGHPPHPMQCLLSKKDYMVFFGEPMKMRAQSFTCPVCGQMGFNVESLVCHAKSCHMDIHDRVLCPICIANRHSLQPSTTQDIVSHLQRDHSLSSGVRDIVALLEDPAGGFVINRRNNLHLRFPDCLMDNTSNLTPDRQSLESVRPLNHLFSHLSNRYNEIGPIAFPRSMSRSHSRLNQSNKHRGEKLNLNSEATPSPPTSESVSASCASPSDDCNRLVSKSLSDLSDDDCLTDWSGDKALFLEELIMSTLCTAVASLSTDDKLSERLKAPLPPKLSDAVRQRLDKAQIRSIRDSI